MKIICIVYKVYFYLIIRSLIIGIVILVAWLLLLILENFTELNNSKIVLCYAEDTIN